MKKITKRLFSLVLATAMMAGFALSSSAAGLVTYEGEAEKFIFTPGTEYSPTDLFTDFKNLMPGDSISQTVRVVNNGKAGYTAKIYLKALGPTDIADGTVLGNGDDTDGMIDKAVYQKLLSQLNLKVVNVTGDEKLFEATADKTDGLTDWVLLVSLRKGGEVDLTVSLEVPVEMGNEFQNVAGALDWAFKIEEIPDPSVPDTGDNTGVMMYAGTFAAAAMALIAIILLKRKKREE